jgi:hypothetical protein
MFANSGDRNLGRNVVENLVADYTLHILLRGMLPCLMPESDFLTHPVWLAESRFGRPRHLGGLEHDHLDDPYDLAKA